MTDPFSPAEMLRLWRRWKFLLLGGIAGLMILMLYVAVQVEPPSGADIDTSPQHQRELLERWKKREEQEKRYGKEIKKGEDELRKDFQFENNEDVENENRPEVKSDNQDNIDVTEDDENYIGDSAPKLVKVKWDKSLLKDYSIPCIKTVTLTSVTVCLHDVSKDVFISKELRKSRTWEPHIAYHMDQILKANPGIGIIDIGANIGFYSLIAAKMGHPVLAVEPFGANVRLFQKAVVLENLQANITLLQNAISSKRGKGSLLLEPTNQGGIHVSDTEVACTQSCPPTVYSIVMDDLAQVVHFKKAFMKIDIEGGEHKAFAHASKLFSKVHIPFIFMEWVNVRDYYVNVDTFTPDKRRVERMIRWFMDHEFEPFCLATGKALEVEHWYGWGHDVMWKHVLTDFS